MNELLECDSVYQRGFPAQVLTPRLALAQLGGEFVFGLLSIPCAPGLTLLQLICFLHHCLY